MTSYLWSSYPKVDGEADSSPGFLYLFCPSCIFYTHTILSFLVLFCLLYLSIFYSLFQGPSQTWFHMLDAPQNWTYSLPFKASKDGDDKRWWWSKPRLARLFIVYSETFHNLKDIHCSSKVLIRIFPHQCSCIKNQTHDGNQWLHGELQIVEMHLCRIPIKRRHIATFYPQGIFKSTYAKSSLLLACKQSPLGTFTTRHLSMSATFDLR